MGTLLVVLLVLFLLGGGGWGILSLAPVTFGDHTTAVRLVMGGGKAMVSRNEVARGRQAPV